MSTETNWAPEECALPTAEQPLRIAEFTDLFAASLRGLERPTPSRLRLALAAAARDEAVRLAQAETSCCSFFSFTVGDPADGRVQVDVEVPEERPDVLDALAAQAATAGNLS